MGKQYWYILLFFITILPSCSKKTEFPDLEVAGVKNPVISLNGTWKISLNPPAEFWADQGDLTSWSPVQVPGECQMQGIPIRHDQPFVYTHRFRIPDDYRGKQIFLVFHGVYSYARLWINGQYIREHFGGFTKWDCNITGYVSAGEEVTLTLEVTDRADDISYASGYAKHQIGGILRDVELMALPGQYFKNLWFETDLDENFRNAELKVFYELLKNNPTGIKVELFDQENRRVNKIEETLKSGSGELNIPVENPKKWDAEHPVLYKAVITLYEEGKEILKLSKSIGFREVEVKGNKLLINGRQVKLRGANRHDMHPLLGRVSTREYELMDVQLAREANINFIRTSHYPPTESFLQLCDEYGIYVEDETAICFVNTHRTRDYAPAMTENDENYSHWYLGQLKEMVRNHRSHPSVIIWSIGNENNFGTNFLKSYNWTRENDPTRPVIFSYPGLAPDSIRTYDILSIHYPGLTGDKEQYGIQTRGFSYDEMPVLFDEWAHVSCYNQYTLKEDPNVRDFWGMSLDSMWIKTFVSEGGLGGAIWGLVDETFMLPENMPGYGIWWGKSDTTVMKNEYSGPTVGYGEWGIYDVWRRKKPEFWNTKKAYSPVRILKTRFEILPDGQVIKVPVFNRFDHTNLNELTLVWKYMGSTGSLTLPDIKPHSAGEFPIPLDKWNPGEAIEIDFVDYNNRIIDSYALRLIENSSAGKISLPAEKVTLTENEVKAIITCENGYEFEIEKSTGLFTRIGMKDENIRFSGPFLNLRLSGKEIKYSYNLMDQYGSGWKMKSLSIVDQDSMVTVSVKGDYEELKNVEFTTLVKSDGSIITSYYFNDIPKGMVREIGLKYIFDNVFDSLSWRRRSYWSVYPERHISSSSGKTSLYPGSLNKYRTKPEKEWDSDSKSFYYNGIEDESGRELTFLAKATKENIFKYVLQTKKKNYVSVLPAGITACRIEKKGDQIFLYISGEFDYPDLAWGNYQRNILSGHARSGKVNLLFHPVE